MNLVVDMNLSPDLCRLLSAQGWGCSHWSQIGKPTAPDTEIMAWARTHQYIVLTHDLDFGVILALTGTSGPSVIQVRTQNVWPEHLSGLLVPVLRKYEAHLTNGALIVVDEQRLKVRILPLRR